MNVSTSRTVIEKNTCKECWIFTSTCSTHTVFAVKHANKGVSLFSTVILKSLISEYGTFPLIRLWKTMGHRWYLVIDIPSLHVQMQGLQSAVTFAVYDHN
jgi:hypothetical protein